MSACWPNWKYESGTTFWKHKVARKPGSTVQVKELHVAPFVHVLNDRAPKKLTSIFGRSSPAVSWWRMGSGILWGIRRARWGAFLALSSAKTIFSGSVGKIPFDTPLGLLYRVSQKKCFFSNAYNFFLRCGISKCLVPSFEGNWCTFVLIL